mmetsp:Transcript_16903/g.26345  ORF Transcript_16903/g.26345 Transcript_16903/m.26345 type:complete len:96 (-) Transcript_16903:1027-1314(-)
MAGDPDIQTCYSILGIPETAEWEDIRKAFKRQALRWHPDKNKDKEIAHVKFQRVSCAYEILKKRQEEPAFSFNLSFIFYCFRLTDWKKESFCPCV